MSDLSVVIHEAALDAVRDALEGVGGAAAPRRGRRPGPGRRKAVASGARKKTSRKRGRRSTEDVEATASSILSYVRANPGCSATDIAASLKLTTKDLRLPIHKLLAERKIRTEGQARGTKYFSGGGRGGARKKTARKKFSRKKKAGRKKTTRRKTTRPSATSA